MSVICLLLYSFSFKEPTIGFVTSSTFRLLSPILNDCDKKLNEVKNFIKEAIYS